MGVDNLCFALLDTLLLPNRIFPQTLYVKLHYTIVGAKKMQTQTTQSDGETESTAQDAGPTGDVHFNMAGRSVMLNLLDSDDPLAEKISGHSPTDDIRFSKAELQRLVGLLSNVRGGSAAFLTVRHNILRAARDVGATPEVNLN